MVIPNVYEMIHSNKDFAIAKIDLSVYLNANVPSGKGNCKQNPDMNKGNIFHYAQLIDSFLIPLQ